MGLLTNLLRSVDDLVKLGYPESVAERIVSGELPMDTASRMARAADQGFDSKYYHGTQANILEFQPSAQGMQGPGIYGSSNPESASSYAIKSLYEPQGGENVIPILLRGNISTLGDLADTYPSLKVSDFPSIQRDLREKGITGLEEGTDRVTFDPRDVRSYLSAAFDPEYKGPNILGQYALPAAGAGLLAAAPEDAEAGLLSTVRNVSEPAVKAVADELRDLLFLHNTSPQALSRFDEIGGIPNPSLAVTQKDIPFEGYGDITLIGNPSAFDPKARSNPLYSADAYTVRAPSPVQVARKDAYKDFKEQFANYESSGIPEITYTLGELELKTKLEPRDYRNVDSFFKYDHAAKLKFADDLGIEVPRKEDGSIDYYNLSDIQTQNPDKFAEWKAEQLDRYFEPDKFLVTNPDYDRYAGRARLKPYTAENVSKWMNRHAGAGKESTMTFGAGQVRASTAERIPSLKAAKQRKGLLQPADQVSEVKTTADSLLTDLQNSLQNYSSKYDSIYSSYWDAVGEMIAASESIGVPRALQKYGFEDVPESIVNDIVEYKDYLRSAPTEYFESKPQRAVQLGDFSGAIVPSNAPQSTIGLLERAGVPIERYDTPEQRTALRDKFSGSMFQAIPAAGALGLLAAPEDAEAATPTTMNTVNEYAGNIMGVVDKALEAAETPYKGYMGLSRLAGGLLAGEGLDTALENAVRTIRDPIQDTAYRAGDAVLQKTGSPELATLGNVLLQLGNPI